MQNHPLLLATVSITAATGVFSLWRHLLDKHHFAFLYLTVIVLVASIGGARSGIVAAILAFFAWNFFFLLPYYTLVVENPEDWLSLGVFLLVGLMIGHQAGGMREREAFALARERETALLFRLSSHLARQTASSAMASVLLEEVVAVTGASCATLFLPDAGDQLQPVNTISSMESAAVERITSTAAWAYEQAKAIGLPAITDLRQTSSVSWPLVIRSTEGLPGGNHNDLYVPLQATSQVEGILHLGARLEGVGYGAREERLILSIAHLAAAFLERQRLQTAASQAEAFREADRLKSVLVSSVSHELKTPLASLTAGITSLIESDIEWEPGAVRQELEALGQDLDRLNSSIGELLDLSRLESGSWATKREWCDLGEIIGTALQKTPRSQRDRIVLDVPEDLPPVQVDYLQWARALGNLVENALAYTAGPVQLGARTEATIVRLWVEDEGPGITGADRPHLFEKFYRGHAAGGVPSGTGLGLAIAREIVHFHGGTIQIEDVDPHGARFVISLPCGTPV